MAEVQERKVREQEVREQEVQEREEVTVVYVQIWCPRSERRSCSLCTGEVVS